MSTSGYGDRRKRGRRSSYARKAYATGNDSEQSQSDSTQWTDPETLARNICLRKLARAPQTRAELAKALAKRGIPDDVAQRVLDRFGEVGLVDDQQFADAWVTSRHHGRGLASRALAFELRHRGIDQSIADLAMEKVTPEMEEQTARDLVAKRLASLASFDAEAKTRRLVGMLARKGYSAELAFRVVREALADEGAGAEVFIDDQAIDDCSA